jgi:hypothetical protein
MTLFVSAMIFNTLLHVVDLINSIYLPFLLGFVYLVCLIPWFFKLVFLRFYKDLQNGRVTHFCLASVLTDLFTCGSLITPTQFGPPSIFEIKSHIIHGLIEIGVLFSPVSLILFVSLVLFVVSFWTTFFNAGRMFELGPNIECL